MKKSIVATVFISSLIFLLCTVSVYAWTGRMAGMGNPYGLVEDESDFLVHPSIIAQGKGITFYGDLSFDKNDVDKWDVDIDLGGGQFVKRELDGDESYINNRLGAAFPVGAGRMGIFLEYGGNFFSRGGRYRGKTVDYYSNNPSEMDVRNENDSITARFLYAQEVSNKIKLGGEFSVGYVAEKNSIMTSTVSTTLGYFARHNYHWDDDFLNGFEYGLPYSSRYWEAKMKGSVEAMIGVSKLTLTPFGSFIFDGDNRYDWDFGSYTPWLFGRNEGSVKGYRLGTEVWWRFPVNTNISVPVTAKIVYSEKKREGDGIYIFNSGSSGNCTYENNEKGLDIEVGAGMDAKIGKTSRFAAGLYYQYIDSKKDFYWFGSNFFGEVNYPSHPQWREDRISLKLAAETEISPTISLSGGLTYYYGWVVKQDYERIGGDTAGYNIGFDGHNWGLGLSAGAAFKLNGITLEPYLKGLYQNLSTSGNGYRGASTLTEDYKRTQWTVGGGFSIKFN